MRDPFHIEGPAIISFSGGRTSAYMLWRIIQSWGGTLPDDVKVCFANTGKEMPETLDFVRDCGERWGVEIAWLEYAEAEKTAHRWKRVDHATAARHGEPFGAIISRKQILPNPVMRYCTQALKIQTIRNFAWSLGWETWTAVIGLRADEPRRVSRLNDSCEDASDRVAPLATAGITKRDVERFWIKQNFGLRLPTINGTTPKGNCDLCFLKSTSTLMGIIRENPEAADWWIEQERVAVSREETRPGKMNNPTVLHFRKDRPSYAEMLRAVKEQRTFDFGDIDQRIDCMCSEDAA